MAVLDRHCEEVGRDPRSIKRSAQSLLYLSDDPAFLAKVRSRPGLFPMMSGGVDEIRAVVRDYAEAGLDELIVPDFNLGPRDLKVEVLDRFMEGVALNDDLMQYDGIHPNEQAQPVLLDNAWPVIVKALDAD